MRVDLSLGEVRVEKVPDEVYERVLSGKGLAAWYLYKNIPAGADPLGPENILCFATGALTGTGTFFGGRWIVACKSPLTGGWGDANCGGVFSPAIKQCGYDAIFISGKASKPVYLYCDNKGPEIRDASKYWGLDATDAENAIHADLDGVSKKRPCVALIGTAGENISLISGICNEAGRIAARSGVGAVMGSKMLKAVVLAGSKPMPCADKEAVKSISRKLGNKLLKLTLPPRLGGLLGVGGAMLGRLPSVPLNGILIAALLKDMGTPFNTPLAITSGDGPIKNWGGTPKDVKGMTRIYNPDNFSEMETVKYHCYSCPLGCGGRLNVKNRLKEFDETHKPEYETIESFGPLLENGNLESVLLLNELLNRAGLDSISAGNTIAWAIECFENGILTEEDTDGLQLTWGNADAIVELTRRMIRREGFGDKIADGVKRASEIYGGKEYAMHVGGQEPGMHDTRYDPQLAVHMVAEPAPGKHTIGMGIQYGTMDLSDICSWAPKATIHSRKSERKITEEMAMISKATACYSMLIDGAGACFYGEMMGVRLWNPVEYLNAATGGNHDGDHYMEIGARIQTLRQMFNIKHGIDPASIKLPKRMEGYPPLESGPLKGVQINNKAQVSLHWKAFGWDEKTGAPLQKTITALEIDELLTCETE